MSPAKRKGALRACGLGMGSCRLDYVEANIIKKIGRLTLLVASGPASKGYAASPNTTGMPISAELHSVVFYHDVIICNVL